MRQSALYLVEFVARLLNDESYEIYSQEQILDALDTVRWEAVQDALPGILRNTASGAAYPTYQSVNHWVYWETDIVIETTAYEAVTPNNSDYRNGRFTFDTPRTESYLFISGFSHDPYGAAYNLLATARSSQLSEDLQSFSTQNGTFAFAGKLSGVLSAADGFWNKSRLGSASKQVYRTDLIP